MSAKTYFPHCPEIGWEKVDGKGEKEEPYNESFTLELSPEKVVTRQSGRL